MGDFIQGCRSSARTLVRHAGFSLLSIATIALGTGATTFVFSLAYGVLWRPIPYPNARRIVVVRSVTPGKNASLSYPDFVDLRSQSRDLEKTAARTTQFVVLTGRGEPERIVQDLVSADYFAVLGLRPVLGRDFTPADDVAGAEPVAVLSHAFRERTFDSDRAALGKTLAIDGRDFRVIGVMPDRVPFYDGDAPQVWSAIGPWAAVHRDDYAARAHRPGIFAVGLARRGVSIESVRGELSVIAARLEKQYPGSNAGIGLGAAWLADSIVSSIRPALVALLGAVAVLLLIVCTNVAGLTIARAAARRREVAIRAALGASRRQIVAVLLRESALLGLLGGAAGSLAAWGGVRWMATHGPATLPRLSELGVNGTVLVFALAVTLAMVAATGLVPAVAASRSDLREVLASGAGTIAGAPRDRGRAALVGAEVALSFVLLVGAGLLTRSLRRVVGVDPGIDPQNVLSAQLTLSDARYRAPARRLAFFRALLDDLRRAPGIDAAGITNPLPFTGKGMQLDFVIEGRPLPPAAATPSADSAVIDPGLVPALRIPLKAGRLFTDSDDASSPRVALINEALARRWWPGTDPVGHRFSSEEPGKRTEGSWITIVGVVGDVRQYGLDREQNAQVYLCASQMPLRSMTLVVRGRARLARIVRAAVRRSDPGQPVDAVRTVEDLLGESYAARRWALWLLGSFAASAALLAGIGLYGVVSYEVVRRTREIGIRMALGARAGNVSRLVLGDTGRAVTFGVVAGAAAAFFATRLLRRFLFGVGPLDGLTFATTTLGLSAVALAASFVPLWRAIRVDPRESLHAD